MDAFGLFVISAIANIFLIIELNRIKNERKKDIRITKTKSIDAFLEQNPFLVKELINSANRLSEPDCTNAERIANGLIDVAVCYLNNERPFRVKALLDKSKTEDFEYSKTSSADVKGYYNFFSSSTNSKQTIALRGYVCEINDNEILLVPIPCNPLNTSIINPAIGMDDIAYCLNQNLFGYILVTVSDKAFPPVCIGNHVEIFGKINAPDSNHEFKYIVATKLSILE